MPLPIPNLALSDPTPFTHGNYYMGQYPASFNALLKAPLKDIDTNGIIIFIDIGSG